MKIPIPTPLLTKVVKKIFAMQGFILQWYQLKVILSESSRIIILKGRAIGLTFCTALKFLLCAVFETKRVEFIIISQDKENSEHVMEYLDAFYNMIEKSPLAELKEFHAVKNRGKDLMSFSNGCTIYSKPSVPEAIRGLHGHTHWTEPAFTRKSNKMYKAVKGCLKPNFTGIFESTPDEESGVFYELWKKAKSIEEGGEWEKLNFPYSVCDIPEYQKQVLKEREEAIELGRLDEWENEYNCKFIDGSSRLFTRELILSCVERTKQKVETEYTGIDFGKRVDQSELVGVGKDRNGIINVTIMQEYPLGQQYEIQTENMIQTVKNFNSINRNYIDATGVGVSVSERFQISDISYLTEEVTFTSKEKEKMAMFLYQLLNTEMIRLPNDRKLIDQIHGIRRTTTDTGLTRYKHEDGKHDDRFWALCLALKGYSDDSGSITQDSLKLGGETKHTPPTSNISELRYRIKRGF